MTVNRLVRVLLGIVVVLAFSSGCAARSKGPAVAVDAPPSSSAGDASLCPPSAGTTVTVAETDTGRTVCARVSQRIEVYLHGTPANPWSAISVADGPLRSATSGKLSLPIGVTGAVFIAVARGQVEIVSTRPMCTGQQRSNGCEGPVEFRVRVSIGD
jgi:hypothetical protein